MQAIRTRYLGATNYKGSRIQAKCEARSIIVPWDHNLDIAENHKAACQQLLNELGWKDPFYQPMVGGSFDNDYYWVFTGGLSPKTDD